MTIRSSSSEVETPGVLLVGMNLPESGTRSTFYGALKSRTELTEIFDRLIHVADTGAHVRVLVVGDIIDLVLLNELGRDDPWCASHDLVDPATMPNGLTAKHDLAYFQDTRKELTARRGS
jgi:hypothetical protein